MINILVVDDHELVRAGIAHLLAQNDDFLVVGAAGSGEEAIEQADRLKPDVILMDVKMPGIGGIEACRKINQKHPEIKVVALSVYCDGPFPQQLLSVGADGYVSKNCTHGELMTAVRTVVSGQRYLSQDVANKMALASLPGRSASPFEQLSYRELEVVIMTLQGKAIPDMAALLRISSKTVNTYRHRAYEKLGVKNAIELMHLAACHNFSGEALCG